MSKPLTRAQIVGFLAFAVFLIGVFAYSEYAGPPTNELRATVRLDGVRLHVVNLDAHDWFDVRLAINDAFELRTPRIESGETFTADVRDFATDDGERFDPLRLKPREIRIVPGRKLPRPPRRCTSVAGNSGARKGSTHALRGRISRTRLGFCAPRQIRGGSLGSSDGNEVYVELIRRATQTRVRASARPR